MDDHQQFFDEMILKKRTPIPDVIYHYTTMEGLLGIIGSQRLRLTHIKYLNDSLEYEFLWGLFASRIRHRLECSELPLESPDRKRIESLLGYRAPLETFVASFSDDGGDRLSQWRGYSSGGVGFSIGFSGLVLERLVEQYGPAAETERTLAASILPVIYMSEDDSQKFDDIIDETWQSPTEGVGISKERMFSTLMSAFAWAYKHNSFVEEKEWRLTLSTFPYVPQTPRPKLSPAMKRILDSPQDPAPGLSFRLGKSMLIPFREFHLDLKDAQLIKTITIGPTPHPDLSVKAVNDLLRNLCTGS